jgi:hypothetical protein
MQRTMIPEPARATRAQTDVVFGINAKGRLQSIVHVADIIKRIVTANRAEQAASLCVILDGTARRAYPHLRLEGDAVDADLALPAAALVDIAKETPA